MSIITFGLGILLGVLIHLLVCKTMPSSVMARPLAETPAAPAPSKPPAKALHKKSKNRKGKSVHREKDRTRPQSQKNQSMAYSNISNDWLSGEDIPRTAVPWRSVDVSMYDADSSNIYSDSDQERLRRSRGRFLEV